MSTLFDTYMANNKVEELSDDQVKDLLKEYRYDENLDARDSIIKNFYPMIKRLINNMVKVSSQREEYISIACMALMSCIDKFDIEQPCKFSTVAYKYISNSIRNELLQNNGLISTPYVESVNAKKYLSSKKRLEELYERKLSVDELADLLNIKPNKILDYENELANIYSLSAPIGEDFELADVISDGNSLEKSYELQDSIDSLRPNIALLKDKRQQLILLYTYGMMDGEEHSQEEARQMLVDNGYEMMSRANVQKLQKTAIAELRDMYN